MASGFIGFERAAKGVCSPLLKTEDRSLDFESLSWPLRLRGHSSTNHAKSECRPGTLSPAYSLPPHVKYHRLLNWIEIGDVALGGFYSVLHEPGQVSSLGKPSALRPAQLASGERRAKALKREPVSAHCTSPEGRETLGLTYTYRAFDPHPPRTSVLSTRRSGRCGQSVGPRGFLANPSCPAGGTA